MDKWVTGISNANGIKIHYRRTGGDKPPIVLLHGLMTSGACWVDVARALEKDYDVVMPDARGHGNSTSPSEGYTYGNLAADVIDFIDFLGLVEPVIVGHSMGGMTAAIVAGKKTRMLRGVVLAEPSFLTLERQQEVYESDVAEQHRRVLNQSKEHFLANSRVRHSHRSQELVERLVQARFQTSIDALDILKPPYPDYTKLVQALEIPSLLVFGGKSAVVSSAMVEELAELNTHVKVAQIREAGHAIPFDQPERFSDLVKPFLGSLYKTD